MLKKSLLVIVALLLISCGVAKDREKIREGLLSYNLRQDAFLAEWGKPDRIAAVRGDQVTELSFGGNGAGMSGEFFKGRHGYEVWYYDRKKTVLFFNGRKFLSGWDTKATVQELSIPQH